VQKHLKIIVGQSFFSRKHVRRSNKIGTKCEVTTVRLSLPSVAAAVLRDEAGREEQQGEHGEPGGGGQDPLPLQSL
jgi:hypothetical protein